MSNNPPARMPDNPLTRVIENAGSMVRGEGRREVPISAGDLPSVRSASIGRIVEPPPLSPAEKEELDAKARELGILPPEGGEPNPYPSHEAALQAGAPVERLTAAEFVRAQGGQAAAPRFGGGVPRLPDFTKVGGIDLLRDVVYVDSMEFPIPKDAADQFRLYAIQIAHATITAKLNEAVSSLNAAVMAAVPGEVTDGTAAEAVQQVQGGEGASGVSAEPA